ncbi:MAG: amidohydrolase family protein [Hyphomonadaceae bacterium]
MIRSLLLAAGLAALAPSALAQTIAITGGKVVTNTSQGVVENGTVVIRDGRIVSVGAGAPPAGASVVEADGKWITPGLFAAFSRIGLAELDSEDSTNDVSASSSKFQASLRAADAFNPDDTAIDVTRIEGFTRAAIIGSPGGDSLFGGYGAIIDTTGSFSSIGARDVVMLARMGEAGAGAAGGSRSAAWQWLLTAIDDAKAYPRGFQDDGEGDLLSSKEAMALKPVVEGRVPLMIEVHNAASILQVLSLRQREPKIKLILLGATEGWRVADQIAAAKVPVIVNPLTNLPDRFEILAATLENASRLEKAGVTVAIADPGEATHNTRFIQQLAGNAVANGMSWDGAFKAITSVPAAMYGQTDLGVLRQGAIADIVIWDGDPLELMSSPDAVYIAGQPTPMESRQTKLRDRYMNLDEPLPQAYERQ